MRKSSNGSGSNSQDTPDKIEIDFDISWKAIAKILVTIVGLYFATKIFLVVIIFFFAFVLMSALMPIVTFLRSKKIPKMLSIITAYLLVGLILFVVVFTISRPVVTEFSRLSEDLPGAIEIVAIKLVEFLEDVPFVVVDKDVLLNFVTDQLLNNGASGVDWTLVTISGFGNILSSIVIGFVISIYFMFDHDHYLDFVLERISEQHRRALAKELVDEVEKKLGNWLFTQGLLMIIIASMTFLMLLLIGVDFALPLAIMTGLFSLIPTLGPVIASVISMIFALIFNGFGSAVAVLIGSVIIQQIDNAFITPRLMGNVSGLSPVLVLLGVMIGFSVAGIVGAILAVPVLVMLKIGLDFYMKFRKLNKANL